ncbi:MAG: ASCH domain-containing protein [Spirochaetales bacterium]|nr:ASCH domain-containing protein [Spirochaetales bacterium]
MTVEEFWKNFIKEYPEYSDFSYEAWHFCADEKNANELLQLTLDGIKRGTASWEECYFVEGEDLPQVGNLSVVTDWEGNPGCVIRTEKIWTYPFKDVPASFAKIEGEGDGSLKYWKAAHLQAFGMDSKMINKPFTEDSRVICEEFSVIYRA